MKENMEGKQEIQLRRAVTERDEDERCERRPRVPRP